MADIQSNSHAYKERVAKAEEKTKKKLRGGVSRSGKLRLSDILLSDDIADIKSYIILDVIVPAIKDSLWNIGTTMLYGVGGFEKRRPSASRTTRMTSYDRYYRDDRFRSTEKKPAKIATAYRFRNDDFLLDFQEDAYTVRSEMQDIIDEKGFVSVTELYEIATDENDPNKLGFVPPYTAARYGWSDIRDTEIVPVQTSDGEEKWMLTLPKPLPVKR